MESKVPPGSFFHFSPAVVLQDPVHRSSPPLTDRERYLTELLAERNKLGPFMRVLPTCNRLLNQEIMHVLGLLSNQIADHERIGHDNLNRSFGQHLNGVLVNVDAWNASIQLEENKLLQKMATFHPTPLDWAVPPGTTTTIVKRVIRLDVPVEKFPNYNFVGRILGPRGNSLKRVEAMTECRIYIRGRGSVKDSIKEEKLKDKTGYEHLQEPLHILVEAEFPEDIINTRIDYAVKILEDLLKPVVRV
ncbi:PREDICTED: KH domain-containing protein At1g09660/At1g09670-like isoform X2 [Ipomoea nil]|uniref:KH domain-containing protein At1g09660/At1g09670-like isoform X2 n=1 Tax=Ipomoea nil TaxID=35883 RepID=UPI0009011A1B|nr:PREDICTED: KH domain-containing protein At1g09660/At1g09670-like isoform X2 [Ipomoea nil]